MDGNSQYDGLLKKLEEEYKGRRKKLEDDYAADVQALERLRRLYETGMQASSALLSVAKELDARRRDLNSITGDVIRRHISNEFTWSDVEGKIKQFFPETPIHRSTIHNGIIKLIKAGEVRIIQKGEGRRPTVFSKI